MIAIIALALIACIAQGNALKADQGRATGYTPTTFEVDQNNKVKVKKDLQKIKYQANVSNGEKIISPKGDLCDTNTTSIEGTLATLLRNSWKINDCPPKAGDYKVASSEVDSTALDEFLGGSDSSGEIGYIVIGDDDKEGVVFWSTTITA